MLTGSKFAEAQAVIKSIQTSVSLGKINLSKRESPAGSFGMSR
jgi:hypothetical protein